MSTRAKTAARSSSASTVTTPSFKANPGQERAGVILAGDQTHTLIAGGSRSGKTFYIIRGIVNRALRAPYSRHLATRFRSNAVRASVWLDTFPKVMRTCFPGVGYTDQRQDGYTAFNNGSQLWFGGLDDKDRVEKILGQEYATIYPGECSQIPYHSILVLRTRLAQPSTGLKLRGVYDLNPVGKSHWTYREFIEHIDPVTRLAQPDPDDYRYCFINPNDNSENLDPSYLKSLRNLPGKYRARFFEGKYVVEVDGALWSADLLETRRIEAIVPGSAEHKSLGRIAIGVDPSGSKAKDDKKHDEIGIVAAGLTWDKRAVVLDDASMSGSPKEWATRVVATFKKWKADVIVAEGNYGGEMVRSTIQSVDANVPVQMVTATRGKEVRAEPISALYEDARVDHAGMFIDMEDQLCQFANTGYKGDRSPDRADALIWALTCLMLDNGNTGILDYYAQLVAAEKEKGSNAVKAAVKQF